MKSFKDIAWLVTEDIYRQDKALSYSTLAKYNREGFNGLHKLFDKIDTPSLTFGSAVDSIITGGTEEFEDRFMVADFPDIPDSIIVILKHLYKMYEGTSTRSISMIPDNIIINTTEFFKYQLNWKPETRVKVIKEKGEEYYSLLSLAGTKTILSTETYIEVMQAVDALKSSEATKWYFANDNPFDNIERHYQLKFKATLEGVDYRCMSDLLVVDHDKKIVYPVDLKTSSHTEWDFYQSFVDWHYHIQARLYWRIIRYVMDNDEVYKDYKLDDYRFIVVNKRTLTPLVWLFDATKASGDLVYGKNHNIIFRDPYTIGKELITYLSTESKVPMGIDLKESNNLRDWLNTI